MGMRFCLSACYRDPEPGIRCAKVLASRMTSVPGGGLRTLANGGRLVKDAPFTSVRGQRGKVFSFYLYLWSMVVWHGPEHPLEPIHPGWRFV